MKPANRSDESTTTGRHWHLLKPVKGESVPTRLLVFQIEPRIRLLDGGVHEHRFRCGTGICYWLADGQVVDQEEAIFRQKEDWFRWVQMRRAKDRCTWLASYGLAYALTLLDWWKTTTGRCESIVSAILTDPPTIIVTRSGCRISRYVDMANYTRDGLRTLQRSAGLTPAAPDYYGTDEDSAIAYSKTKTHFVGDYLCRAISLVRTNRLCAWQPTAASLSFATYRHGFTNTEIGIHSHPAALTLERDALFGGRVQTWQNGYVNKPIWLLDANSLYPFVMRDYVHPIKFRYYQDAASTLELAQALRGYECVASVIAARGPDHYPRRVGSALYWDGEPGIRHLAGAELRQAWALGIVERVSRLARYDAGMPFKGFVDSLYSLKLSLSGQGDSVGASFVKLLLNSLAGKFSQLSRRWVNAPEAYSKGEWRTWWGRNPRTAIVCLFRDLGGLVQFLETGGEPRNSFPGLSASVTAAARIELARWLDTAGTDSALYCDTDSVHTLRGGYDRLVASNSLHPTDLGKLKVVHEGADGHYYGLKHYRVGDKVCCNFLTASAVGIAEGVYRDAARYHFERMMADGLDDRCYIKDRLVKIREHNCGERREVIEYGDVA